MNEDLEDDSNTNASSDPTLSLEIEFDKNLWKNFSSY